MKRLGPRIPFLIVSMVSGLAFAASCARPSAGPNDATGAGGSRARGTDAGANAAPGEAAKGSGGQRFARGPKSGATPRRPPPPHVTTPMPGEPTAATLDQSRLVATTCDKVSAEEIEAALKRMRTEVDASFQSWHDEQPACWEADREAYRERMLQEQGLRRHPGPVLRSAPHDTSRPIPYADAYGAAGRGTGASPAPPAASGSALARPATTSQGADRPSAEKKKDAGDVRRASKASDTNNQVAGVDEADIVKTDGKYVYFASNGALRIVEALSPRLVSVTKLDGTVRELFVEGDRAVVYTSSGSVRAPCTYGYDCQFAGDASATSIVVLDIADRAAPKVKRRLELTGSLVAARRIGRTVHTVVADGDAIAPEFETWPRDLEMCGTDESVVRRKFAALRSENERKIRSRTSTFPMLRDHAENAGSTARAMCGGMFRTAARDGRAFTSVVSFDIYDDAARPTNATMQSRPGAVFASTNALYMSVLHAGGGAESSEIHKFHIGETAAATRYVGSGLVPGHVLNSFSMDEWNGYLRIATSKGRVPDPKVASVVSILAEQPGPSPRLVRVGAIDAIAPGEDIRAVRFDDDRGYVVTFKKTDPLFVMDLYQPAAPRILGELKIPGFSTYIHRIDPDHLLSIGFDANDHGSFAYFDGVILQLFDVKNPVEPKLVHKEKIGTRGSSSAAATDHLAFNFFADEGLLAVPMTECAGGGDGRNGSEVSFSGLLVYDVDIEHGFRRLGGVDHSSRGVDCNTWWSNARSTVKRSIFLDDLVYSIADDRVKVQRLAALGRDVADLSLTTAAP